MKFRKKPESAILWFIVALIPIVNLVWLWKVSKIVASMES